MSHPLFRKASLDRLSSPEELDQIIRISNNGSWAALVAVLLVCGAGTVWAFAAGLPTTATGNGMIVLTSGVLNVVSRGSGIVQSIDIQVGQHVEANQVVARVGQPTLTDRLRALQDTVAELGRKRARDLQLKGDEVKLRLDAIARQRLNTERLIQDLEEQTRLAADQVPVMEQLFSRGLVTNQQVIGARQKLVELRAQSEDRRAQLKQFDAQEFELRSQTSALQSEMRFDLANREREIASLRMELESQELVRAPEAGEVLEIKISPGGTVATNAPVLSIQPDSENLETLAYVSALQAKDIRVDMDARVSPSTVKREEYGFMRGKVVFVAGYPATTAALMRRFQNEQFVATLAAHGPVTEVRVVLERDPTTVSGFQWSSPGGPPIKISSGTLAMTQVVTETRAPITLVVPLLRQTLGL
jgi:HlyD family secretion protein